MRVWRDVARIVEGGQSCALVTVTRSWGSSPRESGARMIVAADGGLIGTIGGGALEYQAMEDVRVLLDGSSSTRVLKTRHMLGPDLGQCCGGAVELLIERWDPSDRIDAARLAAREADGPFMTEGMVSETGVARVILPHEQRDDFGLQDDGRLVESFLDPRRPVVLFGAGHVGRALIRALTPLPFLPRWYDARAGLEPVEGVEVIRIEDLTQTVPHIPAGALCLVMTHSHDQDFQLVAALLGRDDLPYVGMIGSASKKARFARRLREAGVEAGALSRWVCPIGLAGIGAKQPAVIAASVAADLLIRDQALARPWMEATDIRTGGKEAAQ